MRRRGEELTYRSEVTASDREAVRRVVASTGFFSAAEADIAVELVEERLAKGPQSGYAFMFAEDGQGIAGYACFGPIPATRSGYDLYWLVVDRDRQHRGIGRALLARAEAAIGRAGGRSIYADTSGRPQYAPTRRFYEAARYERAAVLTDFYAPGDDKIIYVRRLAEGDGTVPASRAGRRRREG
jgi:D-alanine-D-alanine ligase